MYMYLRFRSYTKHPQRAGGSGGIRPQSVPKLNDGPDLLEGASDGLCTKRARRLHEIDRRPMDGSWRTVALQRP